VASLCVAVLLAACAGPAASTRSDASTTPGSSSPGFPISTAAPTAGPTPIPTLDLPPITRLADADALGISSRPSPDFAVLAAGFLYVSGVEKGIGKYGPEGILLTSWIVPGESCAGLDVGFGAVWSATCEGPGLARIDVATDELTAIDLGGVLPESEASVGAGEGAVWVVVGTGLRELVSVDPTTTKVVARYALDAGATAARAGLGGVWVAYPGANQIRRYDPATGASVATIDVGERPQFLTVGEGAVWTMDQLGKSVSRIDPATNAVVATIRIDEVIEGGDIAVGAGYVWLRGSRTLLFKIDPGTNTVVARYGPPAGSGSVAADDDAVWITAHDSTAIWRLPLR